VKKLLWPAALGILVVGALLAACSSRSATAPPVGVATTPGMHPGQFVWHDLVTRDPVAARRFYGPLLGWEFQDTTRNGRPYAVASLEGRPVAGIVRHPKDTDDPAIWLSYLSVPDVDGAVQTVTAAGGETLYPPSDLVDVARVAVVRDPQGAALGLVRLNDGDPADRAPSPGRFFWMEYLANDAQAALGFYEALSGYESSVQGERNGIQYHLLRRDGRTRAGLFQIPDDAEKNVDPNWLPYVAVADPAALTIRAESLGGSVILAPGPEIRNGTLAIVADPTGGALALQKWPL